MTEVEREMTPAQHLERAEELIPDPPRAGELISHYQQRLAMAEREIVLAKLKMANEELAAR